ncbi:hypothetical protein ACHAP8_011565, partial [Fusarium lateritium]
RWLHRYVTNDVVGKGKLHTPITATTWKQKGALDQPTIRVYYLDEESYVRERIWVPLVEWKDGKLNEEQVKALPSSKLAVTSWGDEQVFLYYQGEDGIVNSLYQANSETPWQFGPTIEGATLGSALAVVNFPMYDKHGIRLYFQQDDGTVVEARWDNVIGQFLQLSNQSECHRGAVRIPATKGGDIAALTWGSAGGKEVLEMRIYTAKEGGYYESPYSGVWNLTWRTVADEAANSRIAVSRGGNKTNFYFIKDQKLEWVEY